MQVCNEIFHLLMNIRGRLKIHPEIFIYLSATYSSFLSGMLKFLFANKSARPEIALNATLRRDPFRYSLSIHQTYRLCPIPQQYGTHQLDIMRTTGTIMTDSGRHTVGKFLVNHDHGSNPFRADKFFLDVFNT